MVFYEELAARAVTMETWRCHAHCWSDM